MRDGGERETENGAARKTGVAGRGGERDKSGRAGRRRASAEGGRSNGTDERGTGGCGRVEARSVYASNSHINIHVHVWRGGG